MPKNLFPEDIMIWKRNPERKAKLIPMVYWRSKKPDPYNWPHVVVELALFADPCGCRRRRLRAHSEQHRSRWAMYYESILDPVTVDIVDPRCVVVPSQNSMFVGKLYANQLTLTKNADSVQDRLEAQRKLTLEFVWIIRPCEQHGEKLSDLRRRSCGSKPPSHLKRIP